MSSRTTNAKAPRYTANLERPSGDRAVGLRGLLTFLLVLLLPPVGLLVMWGWNVFRIRGRAVLTTLATVEMAALLVLLTPKQQLATQLPVPGTPKAVTASSGDVNLDALYNIEELIYQKQLAEVVAQGGTERDLMTEEEKLNEASEANEAILDTVVYSVFNGAKYYHAEKVCQHQTNGRTLTVREAMKESLAPCPNCNPPIPSA